VACTLAGVESLVSFTNSSTTSQVNSSPLPFTSNASPIARDTQPTLQPVSTTIAGLLMRTKPNANAIVSTSVQISLSVGISHLPSPGHSATPAKVIARLKASVLL